VARASALGSVPVQPAGPPEGAGPSEWRHTAAPGGSAETAWSGLDELFVNIQGQRQYLWRAVDQDCDVIDILVQPRRDRFGAERFFRRLLTGQGGEPRRLVTDKLKSYSAARRTTMPSVVHDTSRYANNRERGEGVRSQSGKSSGHVGGRTRGHNTYLRRRTWR